MTLENKKVVILIEDDYQDLEAWYPYYRLQEEGAEVLFAVPDLEEEYEGKYDYPLDGDVNFDSLNAAEYDVVIIPGGWAPEYLRQNEKAVNFVREMHAAGKVVAAICHGPWVLASAGILQGKTATCYNGIRDDVKNAGANYVDQDVAVDGKLITSREPDDLPEFCGAIIDAFEDGEGLAEMQQAPVQPGAPQQALS